MGNFSRQPLRTFHCLYETRPGLGPGYQSYFRAPSLLLAASDMKYGTVTLHNAGTQEHWNTGTLEHWNTGTLEAIGSYIGIFPELQHVHLRAGDKGQIVVNYMSASYVLRRY